MAYGNNLFVTVGTYNASTSTQEIAYDGLIATSPDGANWSILPYTSNYLSGIAYGGGHFVAVGREGSILTSTDLAPTVWTFSIGPTIECERDPLPNIRDLHWQSIRRDVNYVGVNPSTGFLVTSPDGKTWTVQPGPESLRGRLRHRRGSRQGRRGGAYLTRYCIICTIILMISKWMGRRWTAGAAT